MRSESQGGHDGSVAGDLIAEVVGMPKKGESDPIKEKFWRKQFADVEVSGLSAQAFCRQRGLDSKNFFNWKKRLAARDSARAQHQNEATSSDFVPVQLLPENSEVAKQQNNLNISMEVVLRNGIVLRLTDQCPLKLLSSVISLAGVE